MKLVFLGTGASEGWPALFCNCPYCEKARSAGGRNIRTRSQALIDGCLSIDFPADAYMHILNENLRPWEWTGVLFTHSHSDHFNPADIGMKFPPFSHSKEKICLYGNGIIANALLPNMDRRDPDRKLLDFTVVEDFMPFTHEKYLITPLRADHDEKQDCHMYIIEDGSKRLLYAHDTGYFPDETWAYIETTRFDLVSLDCTFGDKESSRKNHMSLDVCAEVRERLLSEGCDEKTRFIVNHFSHNGAAIYDEMTVLAERYGLETSYDGMTIEF